MAQRHKQLMFHQDELVSPNKRYDIMDANKKVLGELQCHLYPEIYMAHSGITLREDDLSNRYKFMLDRKELTFTLDDFRTIFHLPQANDNNHASFVPPPSFFILVLFLPNKLCRDNVGRHLLFTSSSCHFDPIPNLQERSPISQYMTTIPAISRRAKMALSQSQDDEYYENISFRKKQEQRECKTTSAPRSPNPAMEPAESMPTAEKADEMILQDMIQVSLVEQKSHKEQEVRENVALVAQHLAAEEIEKLLNSLEMFILPQSSQNQSSFSIIDQAKPSIKKIYRLSFMTYKDDMVYLFAHLKKRFMPWTSSDQLADNLHDVMMETLPSLVKEKVMKQVKKEVHVQVRDQVPVKG
ncbi:hypothetical protein Tco_1386840 [Tanacetum coccineum]